MAKVNHPLFSLDARRKLGDDIVYVRRGGHNVVESRPIPQDARSVGQLSWRHMFQKVVALWHALSAAEKEAWESLARPRHMTGYAWFVSQALRPNPGIYLPLQGGVMQGVIDMDGFAIQDLLDPVNPQDADTEAARDAAIADALEDCIDSHIHGWDGSDWQKLRVEGAAHHNLRVGIFHGSAQAQVAHVIAANVPDGVSGILTNTRLFASRSTFSQWNELATAADGVDGWHGGNSLTAMLWGYNGATFDRLRTYGTGILKVGRAEIDSTTVRKTAVGAVVGGSRKLFWVACSPGAGNAQWELTDAIAGGGAVVYDHFDTDRHSEKLIFDPPMKFSAGIWIETFTNMTSLVFCYI